MLTFLSCRTCGEEFRESFFDEQWAWNVMERFAITTFMDKHAGHDLTLKTEPGEHPDDTVLNPTSKFDRDPTAHIYVRESIETLRKMRDIHNARAVDRYDELTITAHNLRDVYEWLWPLLWKDDPEFVPFRERYLDGKPTPRWAATTKALPIDQHREWQTIIADRGRVERAEREYRLRAQGYKIVEAVAAYDTRTGQFPITSWMGETESLVIANAPADCLKHGIQCVIVGPDSEVIEVSNARDGHEMARARNGIAITVFKGHRPR